MGDDDEEDWEDVDVTGDPNESGEGISVTVGTSGGENQDMGLYEEQIPTTSMQHGGAYQDSNMVMMEEEVIDEDYDPTDFLHNIGRGSDDQSGLSNNYNGSYQDSMEGAVVTGTVEDDLDISDASDDGDKQQRVAIPLVPFGGNNRQPPPGAMSVRVQEDDEIWF